MARPIVSTLLLAALVGAAGVACSGPQSNITGSSGEPSWIARPNGIGDEGEMRAVYAVGGSSYNPNSYLQLNSARSRARAELARTMRTLVEGLVKDYMSTNRDFYDMDMASSVEYYEDISRQVTEEVLLGSYQKDTWRDPVSQEVWVLMGLDFDGVITSYRAEMEASFEREAVRKRIKAQADDFERKLDEQLSELRGLEADAANRRLGTAGG